MTALHCEIHPGRAIKIPTACMAIDSTKGRGPAGNVAKVMPIPHLRCALAMVGAIRDLGAFAAMFGGAFRTFDDTVAIRRVCQVEDFVIASPRRGRRQ